MKIYFIFILNYKKYHFYNKIKKNFVDKYNFFYKLKILTLMTELLDPENPCGTSLLKLVSRGQAILAEL